MGIWKAVVLFVRGILAECATLAAENLALRRQLAALRQSVKYPRLRDRVCRCGKTRTANG